MPRIERILETALYVADPDRGAAFYERVLGLRRISDGDTLVALDAGGGEVTPEVDPGVMGLGWC